jgi:hypothetical protein
MEPGGLHPLIKDVVDVVSKLVAVFGGILAAGLGLVNAWNSLRQRKEEHRWRQRNAAREHWSTYLADQKFKDALKMLDWNGRTYRDDNQTEVTVTTQEVKNALRGDTGAFSPKEAFVRDCFDELFTNLEHLESAISTGAIRAEDVRPFLEYYLQRLSDRWPMFNDFVKAFGYDQVPHLIERFVSLSPELATVLKAG